MQDHVPGFLTGRDEQLKRSLVHLPRSVHISRWGYSCLLWQDDAPRLGLPLL